MFSQARCLQNGLYSVLPYFWGPVRVRHFVSPGSELDIKIESSIIDAMPEREGNRGEAKHAEV
jgi:hypothetical protein